MPDRPGTDAAIDPGAVLEAARRARGLSLTDAERLTCMRRRFLVALEQDSFDSLPGHAYARAFLRSYATALGLEADPLVDAFERLAPAEPEAGLEPPRLTPPPRYLGSALSAVPYLAAAAVVVAVVAWANTTHGGQTPVTRVAGTSAGSPAVGSRPASRGEIAPSSAATTSSSSHGLPPRGAPVGHTAPAAAVPLVISATRGRCWLLVRRGGPTGPVLWERTLARGEHVRFVEPRVWVRLGAPGMVDVHRGAHTVPGLTGLSPVNVSA